MYIQNEDPQFNNITLNESGNNTVVISQVPIGATYIYGGYYFSVLECINTDIDGDGIPNRLDLDSDGDGCSDAIEGAAAFTNSDLVNSSMPGGNTNTGVPYTGEYNSPVIQNLGTTVNSDGIPTIAATGQAIGTAIIANPILDETANQALTVSDVTYTAGNAVFTITNALANITYELVDQSGNSLSPQVIATQ
jgi:hypothetical protein